MSASHALMTPAAVRRRGSRGRKRLATACLWVLVLALLAGCGQSDGGGQDGARTFTFTAIPDQNEQRLRQRFGQVADYLSKKLNVPVDYVPVKSYAAAVTAFVNGQVQLAWFGGLSGVQARKRVAGARAIAQGREDKNFHSLFIANTSSGLDRSSEFPESIRGSTFTFGSKGSTSGRLMPEYFIRQHFGARPDAVFERVGFSGDHSRTIQLVQTGAYEVGAVNFKVWQKAKNKGIVDTDKVTVIWKTPAYPDYQWTIRGDVNGSWGDGFADQVQAALLAMDDPELLNAFPRSAFVPASNADYKRIREIGRTIGILRESAGS